MALIWSLQTRIPQIGKEQEFKDLKLQFLGVHSNSDLSKEQRVIKCAEIEQQLFSICRTPESVLNRKVSKEELEFHSEEIYKSTVLPRHLRRAAHEDHLAPEAVRYGQELRKFWSENSLQSIIGIELKDSQTLAFTRERELNLIRRAADWTIKWGEKGFGFFAMQV